MIKKVVISTENKKARAFLEELSAKKEATKKKVEEHLQKKIQASKLAHQ